MTRWCSRAGLPNTLSGHDLRLEYYAQTITAPLALAATSPSYKRQLEMCRGAIAALEALLADRLRVLGPDHPRTLGTRGDLARYRGEAGDVAGAATTLEALLTDYVRVLGPDYPETLSARRDVARSRGKAGDAADAATAFEALLTDYVRVLGPNHPDTLATRSEFANWQRSAGSPSPNRAEPPSA